MTSRKPKLKLAFLISGGGTTMEAIIKACRNGKLPNVEPALVISNKPDARGLERARRLGISPKDILVISPKDFDTRKKFGEAIIRECRRRGVNFVGQYGWMVLTPQNVISEFKGHIVNQHPGPLDTGRPDFGGEGMFGLRVHKARLEFVRMVKRDYWTEATCHMVTEEFDKGEIVKRKQMEISTRERAATVAKRLLSLEHEVQIAALKDFSEGIVKIFHRKTPLVRIGEEDTLKKCKKIAIKAYPHG